MEKIDFGRGISMPVQPQHKERAERFLKETLGCKEIMRNEAYVCFQFPNGQILGLTPDAKAPSEEEYENSIWLEITSNDFEVTKNRIKKFGAREVEGGMRTAFFFQVPGGAVFRLQNTRGEPEAL